MWNKNSPRSRLWYQMNNAPLWRISLEKIFPTEEDFMWNKNSPLSRLWYQIDNAPLWRILLEKIFPTEMDFMWNEKFPTVEDIVSKKFFATTEDFLLIPNKNLLQLNSDRVRCGEFSILQISKKKFPTTDAKRVFMNLKGLDLRCACSVQCNFRSSCTLVHNSWFKEIACTW